VGLFDAIEVIIEVVEADPGAKGGGGA